MVSVIRHLIMQRRAIEKYFNFRKLEMNKNSTEMRKRMKEIVNGSTKRTNALLSHLMNKGFTDRSGEWFRHSMFEDVGTMDCSTIERRAYAFKSMLAAMTSSENSQKTHTYEIKSGELIVGTIPMGSVGLGKVFPNYLSEDEKRFLTITNRDMQSTFGHNIPNHEKVLKNGLNSVYSYCSAAIDKINQDGQEASEENRKKRTFYQAVLICCDGLRDYVNAFAKLAADCAAIETDPKRKKELAEIEKICRKVPFEPAETFHEAIQSVYFIHLALHSTLDYVSLGRLDQLLNPYLVKDLEQGILTEEQALELYECLLIKCGERINFNPAYFLKQDHASFGGVFGINPVFLDQIASANNFLQNITIGGVTRDGKDACCLSTKLILKACGNMGLPTPIVDFRITGNTASEYIEEAIASLHKGQNGMPVIFNDDLIVSALEKTGLPIEECRDYGIDGCWEPILNAKCDWVFGMVNFLSILELALNSGCSFSTEPSLLRGAKISYNTHSAHRIHTFEELLDILKVHIQAFMDKNTLTAYTFYSIEGSVAPTPFFSALLEGCLETGRDKTWGGAAYHLIGALAVALPNCANALYNIKKYVFEEGRYTLTQVVDNLKQNFTLDPEMKQIFIQEPIKFGNNCPQVDEIMKTLLDYYYECGMHSKELADKIFMNPEGTDTEEIIRSRSICGYEGLSMKEKFGNSFQMTMTLGCGTFGQYTLMGKSVGASADGRNRGDALAPNLSPATGTIHNGLGNVMASYEHLGMDRFAAGSIVDLCIDESFEANHDSYYRSLIKNFMDRQGNILSISFVNTDRIQKAYEICEGVRNQTCNSDLLKEYTDISVRVGGFNAPFITLPREQQLNYLQRVQK